MVLMRYAHLPAAITSQQSAEARMRFVAGRRLHHAEHIGVNEQLSWLPVALSLTSTNDFGAVTFGLWLGLVRMLAVRRRSIREAWLIPPEVFEAVRRQGRVADRGHNRSVAEIGLDGASVVAVVGELEPAGMAQHVGMHEESKFRSHPRPRNHALISGYGQRRATLRDEDVGGRCGFAQELAQRAAFPRRYR